MQHGLYHRYDMHAHVDAHAHVHACTTHLSIPVTDSCDACFKMPREAKGHQLPFQSLGHTASEVKVHRREAVVIVTGVRLSQ